MYKYCRDCGKELEFRYTNTIYDQYTGEKIVLEYLACPDYKGGLWMTQHLNSYIAYRADLYYNGKPYSANEFGYTRYQTCKNSVIYS